MMELLPPVGWADIATKHDLAQLELRVDLRFQALDHRFEAMEARLMSAIDRATTAQTRVFVATTITLVLAMLGVAGLT